MNPTGTGINRDSESGLLTNDKWFHDTSDRDPKSVPKSGQVQLRAHARASASESFAFKVQMPII